MCKDQRGLKFIKQRPNIKCKKRISSTSHQLENDSCCYKMSLKWDVIDTCCLTLDIYHKTTVANNDYYAPKYAIWSFEQFDWFTLTTLWHWFIFYGSFKLLILHGFIFYGGFDWFVSSLWSTAVLQVDAAQLTLLAVMLHMMDSLNFSLKSLHKQWPKQSWSFY